MPSVRASRVHASLRARFGVCTVLNRKGNHTELAATAAAVSAQNYAVSSFRCSVFVCECIASHNKDCMQLDVLG